MPCGENGRNISRHGEAEHFLWSGSKARIAELPAISYKFQSNRGRFLVGRASGNRTLVRTSGTHKSPHLRGSHPILQQQHTVGESSEGHRETRPVRFHDVEKANAQRL